MDTPVKKLPKTAEVSGVFVLLNGLFNCWYQFNRGTRKSLVKNETNRSCKRKMKKK